MTPEELIASGVLEAYVLGEATAEEKRLVEDMRAREPKVREELLALEATIEGMAMKQAVEPPVRARARLMNAIGSLDGQRVVPLTTAPARKSTNWLMAASVAALIGSFAMNVVLFQRLGRVQEELAQLQDANSVMVEELNVQKASLQASKEELAVMLDPHRRIVNLAGLPIEPTGGARVYWDPTTHEVHINVLSLPVPPEGKQYQLWALADGVPIDAGVFNVGEDSLGLQKMKAISSAQAFAVTLENAGGVPSPTLSAMYLMGQAG
jgi:anti-sigma-K factor RskA